MPDRRFLCTACGKCCKGWLPLSLDDALSGAGRFPLAMVLTTLRQGSKGFDLAAALGTTVPFGKRKQVAVLVTPTSYIPPSFDCPSLADDGQCVIHDDKPARCRTMPFSPVRPEQDQAALLTPRDGWECDTSSAAPVVYRDKKVLDRGDFDHERRQLIDQAAILKGYADALITGAPNVAAGLESAARKSRGGYVVVNFTTLLPRLPDIDPADFARRQLPVLTDLAKRTEGIADLADYHQFYQENITGMGRFLKKA